MFKRIKNHLDGLSPVGQLGFVMFSGTGSGVLLSVSIALIMISLGAK